MEDHRNEKHKSPSAASRKSEVANRFRPVHSCAMTATSCHVCRSTAGGPAERGEPNSLEERLEERMLLHDSVKFDSNHLPVEDNEGYRSGRRLVVVAIPCTFQTFPSTTPHTHQ